MTASPEDNSARTATQAAMGWAWFGIGLSVFAFSSKLFIAWLTGSTAVLSDALESSINLLTSFFAAFAVWLSLRPRDADHPYGHGKVEYFSVAIEGVLLMLAGGVIAFVALPRLFSPPAIHAPGAGAVALAVIGLVLWIGAGAMSRAGRRLESPSIEADGDHLRADAITSLVIVCSLLLVHLTNLLWIDPLLGLFLAGWLFRNAYGLLRKAIGGLMDEANPELLDIIASALERVRAPGWTAPHHTKVHRLGSTIHIDLHLVFPWYWDLQRVHDETTRIEAAMREEFGQRTETMVHMEPCTPQSCPVCDIQECPVRRHEYTGRTRWSGEQIRRPHRVRPITASDDLPEALPHA